MGDTVRLPCLDDRLEGFVMMWKKKEEILTVATQIIHKVDCCTIGCVYISSPPSIISLDFPEVFSLLSVGFLHMIIKKHDYLIIRDNPRPLKPQSVTHMTDKILKI